MTRQLATAILAVTLPLSACVTFGGAGEASDEADGEARSLIVEVRHSLAREGALVIWLSREGDRWAHELGRIIPPGSQAFRVELDHPQNTWILAAARATNPRIPVLTSRPFVIERDAERIFWDLSTNNVRMQ